jgi:hypothetical protein
VGPDVGHHLPDQLEWSADTNLDLDAGHNVVPLEVKGFDDTRNGLFLSQ